MAVKGAKRPTPEGVDSRERGAPCYHHHCLTRRDTRGTEKPTAHVSVIAANARAARYSLFPIASTQATPPAMTAKSKSSDAAHRDGMKIRVTPPCHAAPRAIRSPKSGCAACSLPPPCQIGPIGPRDAARSACHCDAGGGTRTPDTRIMIPSVDRESPRDSYCASTSLLPPSLFGSSEGQEGPRYACRTDADAVAQRPMTPHRERVMVPLALDPTRRSSS